MSSPDRALVKEEINNSDPRSPNSITTFYLSKSTSVQVRHRRPISRPRQRNHRNDRRRWSGTLLRVPSSTRPSPFDAMSHL